MNFPRPTLVESTAPVVREIPSFEQWLVKLARSVKTIPGAGVLLSIGTLVWGGGYNLGYLTDQTRVLSVTSGAQWAIIIVLIFVSRFTHIRGFAPTGAGALVVGGPAGAEISPPCGGVEAQELEALKTAAMRALRHYHNYWMALWVCWLLLYALLMFMHLPAVVGNERLSDALQVGKTFINNCAALSLLYCYLTLNRVELPTEQGERRALQADWPIWGTILVVITIVEGTMVELAPGGRLPAFITNDPKRISAFFGWVSGISSSVVMILYIRRLASRFMACPVWVIVLLATYAALQPGFGVFGNDNIGGTLLLISFALVLKTLLFLYMTYVFRYGWLLCHFVQIAQYKDSASDKMKSFSQLLEE